MKKILHLAYFAAILIILSGFSSCASINSSSVNLQNTPEAETSKAVHSEEANSTQVKSTLYSFEYDVKTSVLNNGLHSGYVQAFYGQSDENHGDFQQQNTLELTDKGEYIFIKNFVSIGDPDPWEVNIYYSFYGSYTRENNDVILNLPDYGEAEIDWGPKLSSFFKKELGSFESKSNPEILEMFTTGFLGDFCEHEPMVLTIDDSNLQFFIEELPTAAELEDDESTFIVKHSNVELHGVETLPENKQQPVPAIIMCHGFNGGMNSFASVASHFANEGFACFRFDFYGGSPLSQSGNDTTAMSILTEKQDLLAIIEYVQGLDYINSERIYLMGESQGGCVAALAAANSQEAVAKMVLLYPAFNIPEMVQQMFPEGDNIPETMDMMGMALGRIYAQDALSVDIYGDIASYNKDVLIFHGDKDPIVPHSVSQKAQAIYSSAELVIFEGEGHGFKAENHNNMLEQILLFIDE